MREIKFRGKIFDNGEWLYGNLIVRRNGYVEIFDDRIEDYRTMRVDPYTVGQYTGLKDKNGKEIYEGDIVKANFENQTKRFDFVIIWSPECFAFFAKALDKELDASHDLGVWLTWLCDYEVIGNIYEKKQNDEKN